MITTKCEFNRQTIDKQRGKSRRTASLATKCSKIAKSFWTRSKNETGAFIHRARAQRGKSRRWARVCCHPGRGRALSGVVERKLRLASVICALSGVVERKLWLASVVHPLSEEGKRNLGKTALSGNGSGTSARSPESAFLSVQSCAERQWPAEPAADTKISPFSLGFPTKSTNTWRKD